MMVVVALPALRVITPNAFDSAWARIVEEHGADDEGVVPIGGAALIRLNDCESEAMRGGEDALDSLEWAVNDVLGEPHPSTTPLRRPCGC